MIKIFDQQNIDTEIIHIGNKDIRGCIACMSCKKNGKCIFDDIVNEVARSLKNVMAWLLEHPFTLDQPIQH